MVFHMIIKDHPIELIWNWTKSFKVLIWVFNSVQANIMWIILIIKVLGEKMTMN